MTVEQFEQTYVAKDAFVSLVGTKLLELTDEKAVVYLKVRKQHLNGFGMVHGGMLYVLADFAFGALVNNKYEIAVTQIGHINYVRAAITDELFATATETVRVGHNTAVEVIIRDGKGEIVCVGSFNGFIKNVKK